MTDFSHLRQLNLSNDRTADFKLYQLGGAPVLKVRSATEANRGFYNQVLKRSKDSMRRLRLGGLSQAMLDESRDEDRQLYPEFVVVGWSGINDSKGAPVPFTVDACAEFLEQLPSWIFDDLRTFCGNPINFVDVGTITPDEVKRTAGN